MSLLLALLFGGLVSTRIGAITDPQTGFFEGVLVWVVSILLMGYLTTSGIGMLAGGAFKMVGGATQAIGTVIQGSGGIDTSGDVDQVLQRLKDPSTAQQIASATGMQQSEVEATLNETAQRVENNRDNPAQAAAEAKRGMAQLMDKAKSSGALEQKAEEVKPQAAKAAWITLGALVLSLLAAVFGAHARPPPPAAGKHLVRLAHPCRRHGVAEAGSDFRAAAISARARGVHDGPVLRVLVVEDDQDTAESLRSLLDLCGYLVVVAHTSQQGIEAARRLEPHIVLCDIGLPDSDGYVTAACCARAVTARTRC